MLNTKLLDYKCILCEMHSKEEVLSKTIRNSKAEHADLRKKQSELIYQGGLLYMPSLMHDFDATVEKVEAKRIAINDLKQTLKHMSQRFVELEAQCI